MEGSGKMLVIAVGEHSQAGSIYRLLRSSVHLGNNGRRRSCGLDDEIVP